ncbi:hypothetical protein [Martelella sp. HB161492]|uniref:hypothetical protein n=1 Tax=Martelella sp. HB161492 TaxID=2720726 RepID=UPI0015906059|nr:hypothetical protein [Martelella sp. HB161492]
MQTEHGVYLPFFITGPGQTDVLLVAMIILTLVVVLLIGVFYLHLHALPERMAHRSNSIQLQLVGILALLSLFTHNNIFWVAALLIVAIRIPDFLTPMVSMARSLNRIARSRPRPVVAAVSAEAAAPEAATPSASSAPVADDAAGAPKENDNA